MSENKKCWACRKTLIGGEKFGLCDRCLNKYGSPAVAIGILGLAVIGKSTMKKGGKIAKSLVKIVKK